MRDNASDDEVDAIVQAVLFFAEGRNAVTAAWISIANIWMFGGLLLTMKKAQKN